MHLIFSFLILFVAAGNTYASPVAFSKGLFLFQYSNETKTCNYKNEVTTDFHSEFPFVKTISQIESVTDISQSATEIRLELTGWAGNIGNQISAVLLVQGSKSQIDAILSIPELEDRLIQVTTDPKCVAGNVLLVSSVRYLN